MRIARFVVSAACAAGLALSAGLGIVLVASDASAQTTKPVEYYVGKAITAKKDHHFGRVVIKAGSQGKVTKVYTSSTSGNVTHLDVQVGKTSATKIAVQTIRDNYE